MRKYSVAMVAACPFPANHGTPAAIREMSEELARRGHTIRVVTYPLSDNTPISGVAIDRVCQIGFNRVIKVGPNYQRLLFDFLLIFKLFQIVRRHRIDLIHAHNYEAALVAAVVGRLSGIPVIYNAINTMIGELPSFGFVRPQILAVGLAKLLDYLTPRVADAVIADTAELQRFLLDIGVAAERVTTINSGVRPEMFAFGDASKVRDRCHVANERVIIYTGTFDRFQGVDYLLAAFKIVHQHYPLTKLVLVGNTIDPTHRNKYTSMAEKLGVACYVTMMSCTLEELPDFLAAADIAVVPRPESAGIPTKLLNYMAAGKAIVSFERSATILENGKTGCLVTPATAEALADGIISLLVDPNLALELGRNARSLVLARFDWRSIVEQIEGIYGKLVAEPAANSHRLERRPRRVNAF